MNEFGLTEKGFIRKRYAEIWTDMQATARAIWGDNINLNENSPLGMFCRLNAWEIANAWQVAEDVFFSAFVDFAEGHQLDLVCQYIGINRTPAMPAQGTIKFTGTVDGTTIPLGTRVATEEGIIFATKEEAYITGGEANVKIEAEEPGEGGNLEAGVITKLLDSITNVSDTVTNEAPTAEGREVEADHDLRTRFKRSVQRPGKSTAGAIEGALMDIPEVWDAYVRENDLDESVTVGDVAIPRKSIYPLVHFGDDEEIARTIYENKAAGIQSYAPLATGVTLEVADTKGITHTIGFDRPDEIYICIDADIETETGFPIDGEAEIAELIESYLKGRGIGRDVIYTRIIAIVQTYPHVKDVPEMIMYRQAHGTMEADSGAKLKVRATFLEGQKGSDGDGLIVNFTDSGSGGLFADFDYGVLTIDYGGEASATVQELKDLFDDIDELDAIIKAVGSFTVADDIGVDVTLANGSETECENFTIGIREVSMPLTIEVNQV